MTAFASPTQEKFVTAQSFIFETAHWALALRPQQVTLGATVLVSKSHGTGMAELAPEEVADLHVAWQKTAALYAATFDPDKINYLALMMVDPNPHFHVIPRYAAQRAWDGAFFNDSAWQGAPDLKQDIGLDAAQWMKLAIYMRMVAAQ